MRWVLRAEIRVSSEKRHVPRYIIGPSGKVVTEIAREVEQELMNLFHCDVRLVIVVQAPGVTPPKHHL
ncbi:unnamed protein product [Darwinula stevensoni]|uniref:Uncharacterized protein n=1 Tax=Darwinula stevensoni TaxID=69355 RepID=A0A7R8XK19_9CRUS|nr:unnamed protein product [Darwinula stevensoni]CAG0892748.1 unnamed protein product [Darwinula stevensoni]